jgi:S-DNA-T family DNA segregation ATPase FtsK/SpoIIIE
MLPERVGAAEIARLAAGDGRGIPVGLGEDDLQPVSIDLSEGDPHLVVLGETGSGKTAFLRTWLHGLVARYPAVDIRVILVDVRRTLIGAVPDDHLGAYAGDANAARFYAEQVAAKLTERIAPPSVTQRELRDRSWWVGPEIYVVVDDFDLVSGDRQGPLAALAPFLPQAREVGLHLVLARGAGGVSRALMSDPLLARLRELGVGGLVLSGDPREGVVLGDERPQPRPPGRGVLVRRGMPRVLVQIGLDEE